MTTHSSTLAGKVPWMEEPGRLQSTGSLGVGTTSLSHPCIGEGNGNPLQYSCLENPRDGRAGWAAVYGVAQSRTRLKRLSSTNTLSRMAKIGRPIKPSVGVRTGSIFLSVCVCSVAQSCPAVRDPWTVAHQAPLSMGFFRQEYWSGLTFSSPGDIPHPGIKPESLISCIVTGQ